jgi:hypothetical protein
VFVGAGSWHSMGGSKKGRKELLGFIE